MSDVAMQMFWQDHPELARIRKKQPAVYSIVYNQMAAAPNNGSSQFFMTSGDFVCTRIVGVMTTSNTDVAYIATPMRIQIVITATSFNFNSVKTEWSTSGIQTNPNANLNEGADLPYPLFVPNQGQVTTLLDNVAAAAADVWISFIGIQIG